MRPRPALLLAAATILLLAVACAEDSVGGAGASSPSAPAGDAGGLIVMATTTIVGDIVDQTLGGAGSVEVLLPPGADPHDFEVSGADVARMTEADLIVVNGLGLEEGLRGALATAAQAGVPVHELAAGYEHLLPAGEDGHGHADVHDPHIWFDPRQMADAVLLLGDELVAAGAPASVRESARAYHEALLATDEEIADILAAVPAERRVLVTSHDNLAYFAARYDFTVAGAAIPSISSTAESSAGHLAELAAAVRDADVPAVFADSTLDPSALHSVVEEAGRPVEVVTLLTGSLAPPGEEGDTYLSMLTVNARRIAAALS